VPAFEPTPLPYVARRTPSPFVRADKRPAGAGMPAVMAQERDNR